MVGTTMALIALGIAAADTTKAVVDAHAAGKAADTQTASANKAIDLQKQIWGQQQQQIQPWLNQGQAANTAMAGMMGRQPNTPFTGVGWKPPAAPPPQPRYPGMADPNANPWAALTGGLRPGMGIAPGQLRAPGA